MTQLTALVQAMATTSPKKRRRTTKAVTFKGDSDSESDDDEPPTPPPAKKPRRQTKNKNRKKVWEEGGKWQPGMDFDREWKRSKGRAYAKAKWEYCDANPVWAKADRIEKLEKRLAREKGSE